MVLNRPASIWPPWPPEVPPMRPPGEPAQPPAPPPVPILPSWEEPVPYPGDRQLIDRLLRQRVIILGGRLDDAAANRVTAQLVLIGTDDDRPIELHLSCPAADLGPSLALAGAVDMVRAPVHAIVRGTMRGAAIAVLCTANQRVAHRRAMFVLTAPLLSGEGTASQLAALADQHEREAAQLHELIAGATGRAVTEVAADLERGRVLGAEEALEYGLVNRLV
jgi:ATP-dependent Clp protease protease subunit